MSTEVKLRPYQQISVDKALSYLLSDEAFNAAMVLPTGSGKSWIISELARVLNKPLVVFCPSKELLEQNISKFKMYGLPFSVFSASAGSREIGKVTFATIGTARSSAEEFAHFEYCIIDECDTVPSKKSSMYQKFFKEVKFKKILGLTATPFTMKTYTDPYQTFGKITRCKMFTRTRPKSFDKIIHVVQIHELKEYLCPLRYIPLKYSTKGLELNSTGADFKADSIDKNMVLNAIGEKLPLVTQQALAKGRLRNLVFVHSVDFAEQLARDTPNAGFISSRNNKKERKQIIDDFKSGKITTLYNCNLLSVGFDFPELDSVILARPTNSMRIFIQQVGRALRIHPSKEYATVVDMCGNYNKFGKVEDLIIGYHEEYGWSVVSNGKLLTNVDVSEL